MKDQGPITDTPESGVLTFGGLLALWFGIGGALSADVRIWIGVTQLVFVVPLLLWSGRTRRWRLFKTFLILAGVVALVNAACGGVWAVLASP